MKNESTRKVINVDKPNYVPLFEFKELDNAVIRLSLFKASVEFDITGQTVKLGAKTSKGLKEQSEGFTINKNNLDIDLKNSILVPGTVEIDLELKDASGTMTTASFFITVKSKVLNDKAVEGTNEFDTFTKTVAKVEEDYKGLRRIIIDENQAANLQDQVNQTNAHLEHKANEVDLIVERKRIDTFTSLSQGSTTGDAELIDARIGANGIVYPNIGDSLRENINELNKDINKEYLSFPNDGYIASYGDYVANEGYKATDFIEVKIGDVVCVKAKGFNNAVSAIYLYDLSNKKVKALAICNNEYNEYKVEIVEHGFVRCSGLKTNLYGYIKKANKHILNLEKNVSVLENEIKNSSNIYLNLEFIDGGYIAYENGLLTELTNYSYTDFVDVTKYKGKYLNVTKFFDYGSGIAQYNFNKKFISGLGLENDTIGDIRDFLIEGDYLRITCLTSKKSDFKLYANLFNIIDANDNPCNYDSDSMSLLSKGVCVGDSFTEGACNINNSYGEQFITDRFNYPKILSKLTNVNINNMGHSGITTKGWFEKYKNADLSGYDFAIIYLGINDFWNNNKTFYKSEYGQIIDKLKSENNHIKIFCVTITKHNDYSIINNSIREIVNEKGCYLIDLEKYSSFKLKTHITGGHPNALGYLTMAKEIKSYISYIIDNDIENFKTHQFTNTNYSY